MKIKDLNEFQSQILLTKLRNKIHAIVTYLRSKKKILRQLLYNIARHLIHIYLFLMFHIEIPEACFRH